MNYRHVYMLIIEHAKKEAELGLRPKSINRKDKNRFDTYFEMHHILPKSIFPLWSKRKSNIVALTAREHFFCHQLLIKIYNSGTCYNKMVFALHRLSMDKQNNYKITSKEYERIKVLKSKCLSESLKGNKFACGGKGYKSINKNGIITRISPNKLDEYISNGWSLGTGKSSWNKGMKMPEEIVEKYRQSHAYLKKPKIKKPRKSRTCVVSEETRAKISSSLKGKPKAHKENYKISAEIRAKEQMTYKILLVNTGEIFNCLQEIINKYPQVNKTHIKEACFGKRKYCGMLNGEKMVWQAISK